MPRLLRGTAAATEARGRQVRKLTRRAGQLAYVIRHAVDHSECAEAIWQSGVGADRRTSLKYLGNYVALSLATSERLQTLTHHYRQLAQRLGRVAAVELTSGLVLWRRRFDDLHPRLEVRLERAIRGRMEGELQVRVQFGHDLFWLTFLIAPGYLFGSASESVLFVGGLQGRENARSEIRQASKLNGEIDPAAMALLALKAIGRALDIREIIGVRDDDQIADCECRTQGRYSRFWKAHGGRRRGSYYCFPVIAESSPLSAIPRSHRRRTKKKRQAKRLIRQSIERQLKRVIASSHEGTTALPICVSHPGTVS